MVLDVASGQLSTLFRGPVTSAAFSPNGRDLAYAVKTEGGASVRIGTATSTGQAVVELVGRQVNLLGFSADAQPRYVLTLRQPATLLSCEDVSYGSDRKSDELTALRVAYDLESTVSALQRAALPSQLEHRLRAGA